MMDILISELVDPKLHGFDGERRSNCVCCGVDVQSWGKMATLVQRRGSIIIGTFACPGDDLSHATYCLGELRPSL